MAQATLTTKSKPRQFFEKLCKKLRFKKPMLTFPHLLISLVFVFVPLGFMLVHAFMRQDTVTREFYFTIANFASFFTAAVLLQLWRSIVVAFLTTVFCLILAYPLALALANSKINKSVILVLMFVLPMYMHSLLRAQAMRVVLDIMGMTQLNQALFSIVISNVYIFFPFMLLPIYTSLANMDKSYLEASRDLGAGSLSTFGRIVLPLSLPGIISGIFMVFMPVLSSFAVRDIVMLGIVGEGWRLFGNELFGIIRGTRHDGEAAAYAFILLAVVFAIMIGAYYIQSWREKRSGVSAYD